MPQKTIPTVGPTWDEVKSMQRRKISRDIMYESYDLKHAGGF